MGKTPIGRKSKFKNSYGSAFRASIYHGLILNPDNEEKKIKVTGKWKFHRLGTGNTGVLINWFPEKGEFLCRFGIYDNSEGITYVQYPIMIVNLKRKRDSCWAIVVETILIEGKPFKGIDI